MPSENVTIVVCETARQAEAALGHLRSAGLGEGHLSVAGRDTGGGAVARYFQPGAGARRWGKPGAFWDRIAEMLPGGALLSIPEEGGLLAAGPLAEWVVAGLENAAIFTGMTALGAALYTIGIPRAAVAEFEAAVAEGKYLVIAHGPAGEVARARRILCAAGLEEGETLSG